MKVTAVAGCKMNTRQAPTVGEKKKRVWHVKQKHKQTSGQWKILTVLWANWVRVI